MSKNIWALIWGSLVGILGGLIGLGGAEFRLPILVSFFNYSTLQAIIINLIASLITVTFSLIFRSNITRFFEIYSYFTVIINILCGSLIGAYLGVAAATRINEKVLIKIVVIFLIFLSLVLIGHYWILGLTIWKIPSFIKIVLGFLAGVIIGIFSSMLGVAGGELIIPTIIVIFSVDIKLAGSLSLAISIPTIIMGLLKYRSRQKLAAVKTEKYFLIYMALGSILGALIGSQLLKFVSSSFLYLFLGIILLISALKLAFHK